MKREDVGPCVESRKLEQLCRRRKLPLGPCEDALGRFVVVFDADVQYQVVDVKTHYTADAGSPSAF